ncbi:hypothetical protein BLOT_012914 [Blomia tropicalis]|nr:hypothetical protein BLOT_012914 [Blomia tropicalis]
MEPGGDKELLEEFQKVPLEINWNRANADRWMANLGSKTKYFFFFEAAKLAFFFGKYSQVFGSFYVLKNKLEQEQKRQSRRRHRRFPIGQIIQSKKQKKKKKKKNETIGKEENMWNCEPNCLKQTGNNHNTTMERSISFMVIRPLRSVSILANSTLIIDVLIRTLSNQYEWNSLISNDRSPF